MTKPDFLKEKNQLKTENRIDEERIELDLRKLIKEYLPNWCDSEGNFLTYSDEESGDDDELVLHPDYKRASQNNNLYKT